MKKWMLGLFLLLLTITTFAQGGAGSMKQNWDDNIMNTLKKDGRIYIVIVVVGIIVLGLFAYMWRMERRLSKMEKELHN
jgi:CcmD family protein